MFHSNLDVKLPEKEAPPVLVGRNSVGKPEFIIQRRAVDKEIDLLPPTEYPVATISEVCISCCPWCGRELDELVWKKCR